MTDTRISVSTDKGAKWHTLPPNVILEESSPSDTVIDSIAKSEMINAISLFYRRNWGNVRPT